MKVAMVVRAFRRLDRFAIAGLVVALGLGIGSAQAEWTPKNLPPGFRYTEINPRTIGFDSRQSWSACHGGRPQRYYAPADEGGTIGATGRARREGLRLSVGETIFTDVDGDDGASKVYRYVGRYPNTAIDLVHVQYFEGDGWILVGPRGATVELAALPQLSPDRRVLAAVSDADDYNFHGVQLVEILAGGFSQVAAFGVPFPCDGAWESSGRFNFKIVRGKIPFDGPDPANGTVWGAANLTKEAGTWRLRAPRLAAQDANP